MAEPTSTPKMEAVGSIHTRRVGRTRKEVVASVCPTPQLSRGAVLLLLTTASLLATVSAFSTTQTVGPRSVITSFRRPLLVKTKAYSLTVLSAAMSKQSISVAIDHPLVENALFTKGSASQNAVASLWAAITQNSFRMAILAFCVAMAITASRRGPSAVVEVITGFFRSLLGTAENVIESVRGVKNEGTPMPFDDSIDGWGVCTLKSRKRLGESDFIQYDFALPQRDYELPLSLGQQVSLMCLDNDSNVARGDFYPFSLKRNTKLGTFNILVPNKSHEQNVRDIGLEAANFVRVINEDMKVGDEIALQPGPNKLTYKGQYLPVTDMIYIAYGTGIAPILEQIREVLSDKESSVEGVTLIWINEHTDDFDIIAKTLEQEYYKHSSKLAVSCLVDKFGQKLWGKNKEIDDVLPDFKPGAMVVLSGPSQMMQKGADYLESKLGYPSNTMCLL